MIAVDEMFLMVAKTHKALLLQSSKRDHLPAYLMHSCSRFNDQEYDNMSAVAMGMIVWRPNPYTHKARTSSIPLSVSYDAFGGIKSTREIGLAPGGKTTRHQRIAPRGH